VKLSELIPSKCDFLSKLQCYTLHIGGLPFIIIIIIIINRIRGTYTIKSTIFVVQTNIETQFGLLVKLVRYMAIVLYCLASLYTVSQKHPTLSVTLL